MADITCAKNLNPLRRDRTYPRVVKRARHNSYRVKRPGDHGTRHDGPATIKLVNPATIKLINFSPLNHHMATTIPTRDSVRSSKRH
jgi:hypothetical protein